MHVCVCSFAWACQICMLFSSYLHLSSISQACLIFFSSPWPSTQPRLQVQKSCRRFVPVTWGFALGRSMHCPWNGRVRMICLKSSATNSCSRGWPAGYKPATWVHLSSFFLTPKSNHKANNKRLGDMSHMIADGYHKCCRPWSIHIIEQTSHFIPLPEVEHFHCGFLKCKIEIE